MPEFSLEKDVQQKSIHKSNNTVISIEPAHCRPWHYHNRDANWLTDKNCRDLIRSIEQNGQIEPILVRKSEETSEPDAPYYDIIYGVRRWYACSRLKRKVIASVTQADDKACMVLMHTENADSKDISEFERAFSFAQQFKSGIFKNQTEMATAMGVSQGLISRMIKAAEVFEYEWLKPLFPSKLDIKIKPAYKLATLLKDPEQRHKMQTIAQSLAHRIKDGEYFSIKKIFKMLVAGSLDLPENASEELVYPLDQEEHIVCKRDAQGRLIFTFSGDVKHQHRETLLEMMKSAVDKLVFKNKPLLPRE